MTHHTQVSQLAIATFPILKISNKIFPFSKFSLFSSLFVTISPRIAWVSNQCVNGKRRSKHQSNKYSTIIIFPDSSINLAKLYLDPANKEITMSITYTGTLYEMDKESYLNLDNKAKW